MKIGAFEFNLRELAGSMGDFGTLFPLAIGYIVVCGLNPVGLFVMIGLANIILGLVYQLPMPLQPMKVIAVAAIAQQWSPSMVYASGFAMGVIWLLFAATGIMDRIAGFVPNSVIRGVQVTLGVLLAIKAFKMLSAWWLLGITSIIIALLLRRNRYAPSAIVLMVLGVAIMLIKGQIQQVGSPGLNLPTVTGFRIEDIWQTLLLAGLAQIPLTATNAVISVSALIKTYWPDKPVKERWLSLNMGIMNMIAPFFGGISVCHGAGGLAGQYYFGARTGGAKIMEGVIEVSIGLFLATSIAKVLTIFPTAIIGAMMFLVGVELTKFAKDIGFGKDLVPMAATLLVSLATNMAYGFAVGLITYYLIRLVLEGRSRRWLYKAASSK
jgi:MFS superfamily sulfate permease-like transporter